MLQVFYDDFELVGAEKELSATMATLYANFAATGNPNTNDTEVVSHPAKLSPSSQQLRSLRRPRRLQHHYPPGYGPAPMPPPRCNLSQKVQWPRYTGDGAKFIDFDMCNVTIQTVYRTPHCEFWEQLCADPKANLKMACAFNRTVCALLCCTTHCCTVLCSMCAEYRFGRSSCLVD